jgi:glycosyltransferase involved in cell wall biosynthesis
MSEKILVCMPTYHSKIEWIKRAVESLQNQTYSNFECFLVKDGCKKAIETCLECQNCEETIDFCSDIRDDRFKFYILPSHYSGAGWGPRNFAIMNTSHPLIAYLDDDNWYEPDHLQSLYTAIKNDNAELAYTGTRLFDSDLNLTGIRIHDSAPEPGGIDTSEMLHTRSLIKKYGGWRYVRKCNDWDIVSRWKDVKWTHTNKITLNFYIREGCGIHRE